MNNKKTNNSRLLRRVCTREFSFFSFAEGKRLASLKQIPAVKSLKVLLVHAYALYTQISAIRQQWSEFLLLLNTSLFTMTRDESSQPETACGERLNCQQLNNSFSPLSVVSIIIIVYI